MTQTEKGKRINSGQLLTEKPGRIFLGALGLVMLLCLINYCYVDLQMIVRHSLNLWDSLFSGNLFQFLAHSIVPPMLSA